MNNRLSFLASIAVIAMTASCAREIPFESEAEVFFRYSLSFDESTKTEISGTGDKRHVQWSEGDEIQYYTVPKQASAASAAVIVDGSNAYVEIPRGRTDELINAVFGATQLKTSTSTENCMYVSSPVKNDQSYTSFAQAHICAAFSDDIENTELSFHNVAAILKFTSSAAIHKVVFFGNNNETISGGSNGDIKITLSGGILSAEAASSSGTKITVTTGGAESDYYIAILPVSFSTGFSVECYDADNSLVFTKKTGSAINTVSSSGAVKILNLGSIQDWIASAPPTAVDLGLSVKWASFNLGASKPEDYGEYYAWGETAPKNEYKWATYQFGSSKNGPFSKYVLDSAYGTVDHKTVLDLEDDAAHAAWGDDWRMPTREEVAELMNSGNCTWTWTTNNGVPGYKITSRKSGYTSSSIFLPANGMKSGSSLSDGGTIGNYWTASVSADYPYFAISPFFDSSQKNSDNCYRYFGLGVRPVLGAVVPVSSITLPETLTLIIGASNTLSATVLPENATYKNLTWTSSDESIATVDTNGKVTSVAPGTATITAYSADGGVKAECVVSSNQLSESITLDKTSIEMYVGDEPVQLTATILPESNTDKSVTWTSSKTSVATVDEEGKVTAVANGTATITAKAKDGSGKSATCAVTVKTHVESVSLDKTEYTFHTIGNTLTLKATVLPADATDKSVEWSSDNENTVSVDANGTITARGNGKATITVTTKDQGKTAVCVITVAQYVTGITLSSKSLTLNEGQEQTLTATVNPETANDKSLKWTSSNESIAKVDANGKVTAVSKGTATIKVEANDGSGKFASCSVTVRRLVSSVELSKTTLVIYNGKVETLTATVTPSTANNTSVSWTSSNSSVATVSSSGVVTGKAKGTATITVTANDGSGVKATCEVEVKQYVTSITLSKTSLSLVTGAEETISVTSVLPDNANDKTYTWSSTDNSVASVNQNGKVTAKAKGNAVIKGTANDGSGVFASCSVVVKNLLPEGAVDLGLSVYWATCNLSESGFVSFPEYFGDYYAWGEVEPYYSSKSPLTWKDGKTGYNWASYKWCNGSHNSLTKYNTSSSYGTVDNKTVLDPEDDVAHVTLGGNWRMPTDEEWTELRTQCTWTWTTQNEYRGRKVTGPNGNSIFLPAARGWSGTNLSNVAEGFYWSSSLYTGYPDRAWYVNFGSGDVFRNYASRYRGLSVRPVAD